MKLILPILILTLFMKKSRIFCAHFVHALPTGCTQLTNRFTHKRC